MAETTIVAPATTPPDLGNFKAYSAARESGWEPREPSTPAESVPAAEPVKAALPAEGTPESTSEPAGEKPPEKVEPTPEPEAGESQEQKTESGKEPEGGHAPAWFRKLDKQRKREIREARDEVARLRVDLAARSKPEPATVTPVAAPVTPAKPKLDDFDGDTVAYLEALSVFNAEQIADRKVKAFQESVQQQLEAETQGAQQRTAQEAQMKAEEKFATDVEAYGREHYPDFDEVVFENPNLRIPQFINNYILLRLKHPADSAYFVASNPAFLSRIAVLPQDEQIYELRTLDARFEKQTSAPVTRKPSNGSLKPAPINPVGESNSAAVIPDITDPAVADNFKEYRRRRLAQLEQENRR